MINYYPKLVQVDKIYATRKNRKWLKERGIRITAVSLGRKRTRKPDTCYQEAKRKKEAAEKNQIEGKFGQEKNGYNLNQIRAILEKISESWVATRHYPYRLDLSVGKDDTSAFLSADYFIETPTQSVEPKGRQGISFDYMLILSTNPI